jgi:chemotaxis response regulator CheB
LLLTGAGQDGLDGMIAISQSAGWTLVQHPEEAYMPSMPLAGCTVIMYAEPTALRIYLQS